jgi:hypothetical protein
LVSFDRSDIFKQQKWFLLLLKVCFCIEFFDFSCMDVVSLHYEWSWALRLSAATVVAHIESNLQLSCKYFFWRKKFWSWTCPTTELLFVYQNFALFFFKRSLGKTNISVANPVEILAAKYNFRLRKISAVEKICNRNFLSSVEFFA